MCYPARCARCGKTGWAGCGQHVDRVMKDVPAAQRCVCREVPDDDPCDMGCPDDADRESAKIRPMVGQGR